MSASPAITVKLVPQYNLEDNQRSMDANFEGAIKVLSEDDYVAVIDGTEVGWMNVTTILRLNVWTMPFVGDIQVAENRRRQGIGHALVAKLKEIHGNSGYCGGFTEEGERFWPTCYDLTPLPERSYTSEFI